ncbi:FAD-binding oxidoreductase [Sporocytophaga sp.]|uniref:NAD(P)/FAD-dependent oxidoreductase n=1 Tax=Sporocytophaga sp. TaxID=2231183 RepID=UPI0025F2940F|nr:FAD-dependent oxidoreductase [Sporocytophaga sp.]
MYLNYRMIYDYIIVGQGIAGSVLGYTLIKKGLKILIVDGGSNNSSKVAAGIFNPITGKRMVKTWKAELLFPFLNEFYPGMEKDLDANFFHPLPIFRPFGSIEEQNHWVSHSDEAYNKFSRVVTSSDDFPINKNKHFGGLSLFKGGYVDTVTLLSAAFKYFEQRESIISERFNCSDLVFENEGVTWGNYKARKVIFAEGFLNQFNPYFNWIPYIPVKGEVLTLKSQFPLKQIISKGVFVVPLHNGNLKAGSTYDWKDLTDEVTQKAREEIEHKLKELVSFDFEYVRQEAGIRPSTSDRRPILGLHPKYPELAIFNGLGTKGISLAPYFAEQLFSFLEENKPLDNEVNISRFESFFYRHIG